MAIRASYLVDGFNLYHSLKEVGRISQASVNIELEAAADFSFKIGQKDLMRAQFPVSITRTGSPDLTKPSSW
jgi:hypothetical protein